MASMKELLIYVVSLFGMCFILGHSQITLKHRIALAKKFEGFVDMLECPACLSYWIGLFIGLSAPEYVNGLLGFNLPQFLAATAFAIFSSGSSTIIGLFSGLIDSHSVDENVVATGNINHPPYIHAGTILTSEKERGFPENVIVTPHNATATDKFSRLTTPTRRTDED